MSSRARTVVAILAAGGGVGCLLSDLLPTYERFGPSRSLYSTATGVRSDHDEGDDDLPQFNTINPHEDWCPEATCKNSPLCQPCQRRFLVIISTGRSGSTSLMSMMNLLPGVRISGENNNELSALGSMISNFVDSPNTDMWRPPDEFREEPDDPSQWKDMDRRTAWDHNYIPPGSLSCPVQRMIEAINPPPVAEQLRGTAGVVNDTDIIGFKTIRFFEGWEKKNDPAAKKGKTIYSIKRPLNFFLEHFPCSRVVVNIRSDETALENSYKKAEQFMKVDVRDGKMREQTRMLRNLAQRMGPQRAKLMDMVEWGNDPSKFTELAEWLGFEGCAYSNVLHNNGDNGFWPDERNIELGPMCRYVGANYTSIKEA